MRSLLVEDHPPLAEAVRDALSRAGFDHATAAAEARDRSDGLRLVFVMAEDPANLLRAAFLRELRQHAGGPILPLAALLIAASALVIRWRLPPLPGTRGRNCRALFPMPRSWPAPMPKGAEAQALRPLLRAPAAVPGDTGLGPVTVERMRRAQRGTVASGTAEGGGCEITLNLARLVL